MNKHHIAIGLFIIMLAGLFWSRAILSISQGLWALYAIFHYRSWWPQLRKEPLLRWSLCPLVLFLPGWYQQPGNMITYDLLLTLCMYPVAMLAVRSLSPGTVRSLVKVWQWAAVLGLLYPLGWYLAHVQEAHVSYKEGRSLPTFMDTDHVRFGIFLCSTFVLSIAYKHTVTLFHKLGLAALLGCILLLSVRTAWLIVLCIGMAALVIHFRSLMKLALYKWLVALVLLVGIPVSAYFIFPTVQQKVNYTLYDWQQFRPGNYPQHLSDGVRRSVNKAAVQALRAGESNVGWAKISPTMEKYLSIYFPGTKPEYGWPFNQWLFWWMGSGIIGMLLFTAWLYYPFLYGWKKKNNGLVYWTVAITASCLVESTLALQYGVFLHAWPLALLWNSNGLITGGQKLSVQANPAENAV
ncbi:MAG: hypothetical protein JWQ78_1178 [Sediminibacterium sp.]|nr:hypothetical protein [Sediminibacterium sp.]